MVNQRMAITFFCIFAVAVTELTAQTEQFKFKRLDLKDGLSHPDIWTIFKDSRGFVWFGTASGLDRFDGYTIKSFLSDPHDTTSIPGDGISRISETPDRRLAIRTTSGLTLYDPETETFQRPLQPFFEKYGASNDLTNIVPDADGSYWFIEPHRLIRYHPTEGRIVIQNSSGPASLVGAEITDFCIDRNRNHWVVYSNGIAEKIEIANRQGRVVQRISAVYDSYKSSTFYKILSDADGDLWFCTPRLNQGILFYNIRENRLEQISVK